MRIISLFCIIGILLSFSLTIEAEDNSWSFTISDPVGDDYGPGNYKYPEDEIFSSHEGLFDIKTFNIKETTNDYIFEFEFVKLTDPWNSKHGFSHPLIEIYIDNNEKGSTELIDDGANVSLDPDSPWNKALKLSGWWFLAYEWDQKLDDLISIDGNFEERQGEIKNSKIEKINNTIKVKFPKKIIGELEGANLQLIVGSFDPFGPGYFRLISNTPRKWNFYAEGLEETSKAPRVIDTILPEDISQEEALSVKNENGELKNPQLKAIYLPKSKNTIINEFFKSTYFYILSLLLITLIIIYRDKLNQGFQSLLKSNN
ncbi:MAG: glucodextranase DOMON-like domain-containing protein [Bacillota bacterium]